MAKPIKPRTPNQRIFVREYLSNGHNGYQAALAAGYSESAAKSSGKILNNVNVKFEMNRQMDVMMKRYDITEEMVVQELACIAFMDIKEFYDEGGNLLKICDMPEQARRAVAGLDIEEVFTGFGKERELTGHLHKFKINSKLDALKEFMKYLRLYPDKEVKIKGDVNHDHKHEHKIDEVDLDDRIKQLIGDELGDALQ